MIRYIQDYNKIFLNNILNIYGIGPLGNFLIFRRPNQRLGIIAKLIWFYYFFNDIIIKLKNNDIL